MINYSLQFFAKDGPGGEKTELATSKKLDDARNDGQVSKSKEIITAISLLSIFILVKLYISTLGSKFVACFSEFYGKFGSFLADSSNGIKMNTVLGLFQTALLDILIMLFPIFVVAVTIAILGNVLQQKWKITTKPLQPKLSKISPLSGFKRMFSFKQVVELLKSTAMVCIIGYVVYTTIKDKVYLLFTFYDVTLFTALGILGNVVTDIGIKISVIFLIIGFIDLFYQRHKFKGDMMMSKQEIKDEFKNSEGDPQIKSQIKRKMQEASRKRMMQALPEADVVITNPTHFAVALKYEANSGKAPIVVAKGADYLALQIKEKAKEYKIEIVENKPLARLIYNNVDIGAEIPNELYQAVAEVLAFVFTLKNK